MAISLTTKTQLTMLMEHDDWHYCSTKLICPCPVCVKSPPKPLYLRMRPDGRLLVINEEDALEWYGIEKGSGDTTKLTGIFATQPERSAVIREFSRGVGTPTNKEMKTNSEEGQVEESSKQVPMDPTTKANKQEESSQRNLLSPHKIACIQIEQTEHKKRVQPPCHCHSCSAFFWFAGADSPSLVALEKGKAAADVQLWTENSLKKSKDIRRGLTQYGATLRKRWTKKFSSTKGQHIKLLANVQAALKERDAGNEMEESSWFTMTEPFGSNARARMLTTALNPDHLLECPENLFEQFENRSKHPSQLFYADYHCMYSVSAHRTTLRHSFIPGAFNVTAEKYGQWQDWHDEEVHRFQAVAASVSYLVFESQSEIMNVLWEIFNNLADKLPLPNSNTPSNTDQEQDEASEPIPLPSFINPQSLYTDLPSRKFTIQDAYQLCNDQLNYCVTELTKLRQSPTAFNRRRNQSEQLQKMVGSCERFVPYLLLIEPQERVLWWLLIVAEARSLLHALKRSREDGIATSRLLYVSKFKSLVTTIRHRSDQLLQIARAQGLNNAKLGTVVPFSVSRRWGDVNKFLREIAFSEPLWKSRFTNQIACKGVIKAIINDLPRVHVFIQEWANEGMLITRVQEVLMACEPTIVVHGVAGFDEDEHVRHKLYPNLTSHEHKISMQARTQFLATAISAFDEHTDTRFTASDLSELWTLCQRLSLVFYKGLGFDEECLDQAEDVWVCTDPGEPVEGGAKLLQPRKRNGHPAVPAAFHTTIPHHIGEEKVSGRKLTVRTRSKLVPVASDSGQSPLRQPTPSTEPTEAETLEELRIPVSQSSMGLVAFLFSNAQSNTKSIRWKDFCNFMIDAGCEVNVSRGSGVRFSWTDHRNRHQKQLNLHRPHPTPTLEPQMLRNAHTAIRNAFEWKRETFVERKPT